MKKFLFVILIFCVSAISALALDESILMPSVTARVQNVEYVDLSEDNISQVKQNVQVKLLSGNNEGEVIEVDNMLTGNPYYDIKLKSGMKVILHVESSEDGLTYSIEDIHRSNWLIGLSLIFCGLLVYVGKKKGLFSLIAIGITAVLICNVLSPLILFGINPVIATIIICLLSTAVTMYLVGGFNRKSTSATLGCTLSLITAGILSLLTVKIASLNGFSNENSIFLYSAHPELDFVGITISTMVLATLGAVMDVGMSIASTINEIYTVDKTKTVKELFICGMNVGRDIIGTMANTLILVYMGGALPLIMLSTNIDLQKFINLNQVVTEISSALIGSIAIVICVPITAFVAAELIKNTPEKFNFDNLH